MLKSNFKRLAIEPLQGFGSSAIYISQLGIKTNSEGQYYLDEAIFEKTLSANPEYFSALKDDNLSTSTSSASIFTTAVTEVPPGTYTVAYDGSNWKFGDSILTSDGAGTFTSSTYPGLRIETIDANPAQFDVYIGKSFAQKISDLMSDTLADGSSLKSAETAYQNLTEDINERLEKLDLREELISTRYTEQFGAMESAMTQFNSTKTMLENFIEAWKKQK
jgi:flagellar capping protein FliD